MEKIPKSSTFPRTENKSQNWENLENILESATDLQISKTRKMWNSSTYDLFERCVEYAKTSKSSDVFSIYDKKVLKNMKECIEKVKRKAEIFAVKKFSDPSLYLHDREVKQIPPSPKLMPKVSESIQIGNVSKDLRSSTGAEAKPRLVKVFPPKVSLQVPKVTRKFDSSALEGSSQPIDAELQAEEDHLKPPPAIYSFPLPKMHFRYEELDHFGKCLSVYQSWSLYVFPELREPTPVTSALRLGATTSISKLKIFVQLDPKCIVREAFHSSNTLEKLENVMKSKKTFFKNEWPAFFSSIRKYSISFFESTGLFKYLLLAFRFLNIMHLKKISRGKQYIIMVDFALAIYKFAYETKFRYNISDALIKKFNEVQKEFWSIVVNQKFDPRDNDFFKHLSILSYAALQTNIGFPERAKAKLQDFCDILSQEKRLGKYYYTRGLIISLYFYQLALAMERDLETRVTHEIRYKEYIKKAYECFYDCFSKEETLLPFYGFVVRDYIRLLWNPDRETKLMMLELYNKLKERKSSTRSDFFDLLVLMGAIVSGSDPDPLIYYCDWPIIPTECGVYNPIKLSFLTSISQFVFDLMPILLNQFTNLGRKRARTILARTYFLFKFHLKNVKYFALSSNLFVQSQYNVEENGDSVYCDYTLNIGKELWEEAKKSDTALESRHYLGFAGIFLADVCHRLNKTKARDEIVLDFNQIHLGEDDRLYSSFLEPTNEFQFAVSLNQNPRELKLKLDRDLKIRVYWGVGGNRLFREKSLVNNDVTKKWRRLLFDPLFR